MRRLEQINASDNNCVYYKRHKGVSPLVSSVEAFHEVEVGTDEGEAPVGAWDRLVEDMIELTVVTDVEGASLACGHLVAEGDQVGIATGIGITEDGLAVL